jgi:hypothetical protein
MSEAVGTFACPICGHDKPHGHPDVVTDAWRDDQRRADGWTSTIVRTPTTRGFYLCTGHTLINTDNDSLIAEAVQRRGEAERGGFPAEVLEWDGPAGHGFLLFDTPFIGRTGKRKGIFVRPTHWRDLPTLPGK